MDKETVLNYPPLPAKRLMNWQKRAWREWTYRSGPMWTYLKMLLSDSSTFANTLSMGFQHLKWQASGQSSGKA
jgi:anaerobic magnesium-protoporphyrin IX monomethyl ester cyclase